MKREVNNAMKLRYPHRFCSIAIFSALAACGGGGNGNTAEPATLKGLRVEPGSVQLVISDVQQFQAIAEYSDGTNSPVTNAVSWNSSDWRILRFDDSGESPGQAIAAGAAGDAIATARYAGFAATAVVNVSPRLVGLEVSPARLFLPKGFLIGYEGRAVYGDNYGDSDVTAEVAWSAGDTQVAEFVPSADYPALLLGKSPGVTEVAGEYRGFSDSGFLKVLDIDLLDAAGIPFEPPNGIVGLPKVATNQKGESVLAWQFQTTGEAFAATYLADGTYVQGSQIDRTGIPENFAFQQHVATNATGKRLVAWVGLKNVYASQTDPGGAFTRAGTVNGSADATELWGANLDAEGNGYLVWRRGNSLHESRFSASSSVWEAPITVGTTPKLTFLGITAAYSGIHGAVAWRSESTDPSRSDDFDVWVSTSVDDPILGRSWSTPTRLATNVVERDLFIGLAIDGAGRALSAWVDSRDPNLHQVYWARLDGTGTWSAAQALDTGTSHQPEDIQLRLNQSGSGIAAWHDRYDVSVNARVFNVSSGWDTPLRLRDGAIGTPEIASPHVTDDGRVLLIWKTSFPDQEHQYETMTYSPGVGWSELRHLDFIGKAGEPYGVSVGLNGAGRGALGWYEIGLVPNPEGGWYTAEYLFGSKFEY